MPHMQKHNYEKLQLYTIVTDLTYVLLICHVVSYG